MREVIVYHLEITTRLADESVIGELSYSVDTVLGDSVESEMVFSYILFPSEEVANVFVAKAENTEPTDLEDLVSQLGADFLW